MKTEEIFVMASQHNFIHVFTSFVKTYVKLSHLIKRVFNTSLGQMMCHVHCT